MSTTETAAERRALLDVHALSAQIGMTTSTIYRKRSMGESLPKALKIGGLVRWRQGDVDSWLDQQMEDA
ncbi:helix-turn-helix transcriptional regulator [Leucobacter chromiireducens]|uniref:helix-turn-helix transcriptional regulator n=1 Tax=Leucobacter chromiireducens TaxID=283877 RepID=UPI0013DDD705|nr:AlpA family phage regulatory protein [Leucobacter chromiireducens]